MRPAVVVFALAVAAQWLVPLAGVWRQERVLARGATVRIECAAPDPSDPLRGRYLAVQPTETRAPAPPGMPRRRVVHVWATLAVGGDGLARIESLAVEPVRGPTVIRLVARRAWENGGQESAEVALDWPIDRFYLNEQLAPGADKLVAGKTTVAELRLLDGRAVLADILLDGVSVRELAKRQAE
jgi:hypothetical protein